MEYEVDSDTNRSWSLGAILEKLEKRLRKLEIWARIETVQNKTLLEYPEESWKGSLVLIRQPA